MANLLLTKGSDCGDEPLGMCLAKALGSDAQAYACLRGEPSLDAIDAEADAAIRAWQSGIGITADGVIGPRCRLLLDMGPPTQDAGLTVAEVGRLFPATKPANIARYLPYVEAALSVFGLSDRPMLLAALGTIRAETEGFVPIREFPSKYNTDPGKPAYNRYDGRADLGNIRSGDGARFCGRGFVQLTGRQNYERYAAKVGLPQLVEQPELANAPEVAAVLLAAFLADRADDMRKALAADDLRAARRLVNGGSHGLDRFREVFERAKQLTAQPGAAPGRLAGRGRKSGKGNGVAALSPEQRRASRNASTTRKDSADLRDREYVPPPASLPPEFPPPQHVAKYLQAYAESGLVLDQGQEGACTGFGLSCVINYMRWTRAVQQQLALDPNAGVTKPKSFESVSPRMLYTYARRNDEFDGEDYDGSTCRGALKGWFNHGVCLESDWPYRPEKSNPPKYGYTRRAAENSLGVYYRIDTKSITDLQAAIAQSGAVFVSTFTHDGWDALVDRDALPGGHKDLPVIPFEGRPSQTGGHAFALVGFNQHGFVLQNSWGRRFGAGGFAVISYLDWLANAMDAWVVSLGVPGVVAGRLALGRAGAVDTTSLAGDVDRSKWWPQAMAYRHSVVLANDGRIARFLTEDEPARTLQQQAFVLPDQWFRSQGAGSRKRLVIYAHGGLNSEEGAIKRASAMGRYFIGNGCYPLFLVWKTGLMESLGNMVSEAFGRERALAGGPRELISEANDRFIESTIGRLAARPVWSEMKENAQYAFAQRRGGDVLLDAIRTLAQTWGDEFELHLVGHSAGAIILGHLLERATVLDRLVDDPAHQVMTRLASVHLYAPACTVDFANRYYALQPGLLEKLHLHLLSDRNERDDNVAGIYRKSLLYLVSNALERDRRMPLLGLENVRNESYRGWDGSSSTAEAMRQWHRAVQDAALDERIHVLSKPRVSVALASPGGARAGVDIQAGHGCFDNDVHVIAKTLQRIVGASADTQLPLPVDDLRGF